MPLKLIDLSESQAGNAKHLATRTIDFDAVSIGKPEKSAAEIEKLGLTVPGSTHFRFVTCGGEVFVEYDYHSDPDGVRRTAQIEFYKLEKAA